MAPSRLELGALDRHAPREIDHAVGRAALVLAEEELRLFQNEMSSTPVPEPRALFGEPAAVVRVRRVVADARGRVGVEGHGFARPAAALERRCVAL